MPFDLKAWMNEVGLDDASQAAVSAHLSKPEVIAKLQSSVMRTADYKKSKDALDKLQKEIADKDKILDGDFAKLGEHRADLDKTVKKITAERNTLATKAAGAIAKLRTIAEQNGLNPDELDLPVIDARGEDDEEKGKGGKKPEVNTEDFVSRRDFQSVAGRLLLSPAELMDLDDMHKTLFDGKPLVNKTAFNNEYLQAIQAAAKAGKSEPTLTQFFEAKFNVADRRKELQDKDIEDRIKRGVEEGLIKERSNRETNRGVDPDQPDGSPILRHRDKLGKRDATVIAGRENRGVVSAIASYDEVKSRIDRGGTAA